MSEYVQRRTGEIVRAYMARIGRKGGLKRKLTTEEAKQMAAKSVAARAEKNNKGAKAE